MRLGFVAPPAALVSVFRDAGHDVFTLDVVGDVASDDDSLDRLKDPPRRAPGEYREWAMRRGLRAAFFFGDAHFDEIAALKQGGVVTIGAFPWDGFDAADAGKALAAFDCIYALSDAEAKNLAADGVLTPRVRWGAPPDLARTSWEAKAPYAPVSFLCTISDEETAALAAKAFAKAEGARLVAVATAWGPPRPNIAWRRPSKQRADEIELLLAADVRLFLGRGDASAFAAADAVGAGLPIVCPDAGPWNEHVRNGLTGLVVKSKPKVRKKGFAPDADVSAGDIADAVRRLSDRRVVDAMAENTKRLRAFDYDWARTKDDLLRLLDAVVSQRR